MSCYCDFGRRTVAAVGGHGRNIYVVRGKRGKFVYGY